MRVVIAPTTFKGSLSAWDAAEAMALGVRDAQPDAQIDICPLGDGGEGTAEILARSCARFEERWSRTIDPLGRAIEARWFVVRDAGRYTHLLLRGTAVVDAASCLGITLIDRAELDPMRASSAGLGTLLRAIVDEGIDRIVIGLGGTATMDAGIGMAGALGWRFTDAAGAEVEPVAMNLARIAHATTQPEALGFEVIALCDVRAPLAGPHGAARVFGPQKGARRDQVERLDSAMASFARAIGGADPQEPGAGAAGGLGWALQAFVGASLLPGARAVLEAVGFDERAHDVDLILTGEGKLDAQTGMGKVIAAVCAKAKAPVVAIVGRVEGDASALGLARVITLSAGGDDDARAMAEVRERLRAAAAEVVNRA